MRILALCGSIQAIIQCPPTTSCGGGYLKITFTKKAPAFWYVKLSWTIETKQNLLFVSSFIKYISIFLKYST